MSLKQSAVLRFIHVGKKKRLIIKKEKNRQVFLTEQIFFAKIQAKENKLKYTTDIDQTSPESRLLILLKVDMYFYHSVCIFNKL